MPIALRCGSFKQHFDKAGGLCLKFSYPQSHSRIDKPLFYLRIYDGTLQYHNERNNITQQKARDDFCHITIAKGFEPDN